ncbi:MAG: hypothetical protein M1830_001181 [Pleopsidium flavum]|nr:MAG: hypothetical protein M1830_001181 [Pleopsidium flavum]
MADRSTEPWRSSEPGGNSNQGSVNNPKTLVGPKSRMSSYLGAHRSMPSLEMIDPQSSERFVPRRGDHVYNPEPEHMITTMMIRLLARPTEGLPPEYNSFLLHVFESYRKLQRDRELLQCRLDEETHDHQMHISEFQRVEALWLEEKRTHKAELRRVELLGAQGGLGAPNLTSASRVSMTGEEGEGKMSLEKAMEGNMEALRESRDGKLIYGVPHPWPRSPPPESIARPNQMLITVDGRIPSYQETSSGSVYRYAIGPNKTSLLSGPQSRRTSISVAELLENDTFSVTRDQSLCYEGDETQVSLGLLNANEDLSMAVRLSSWLADRTEKPLPTNPRRTGNSHQKPLPALPIPLALSEASHSSGFFAPERRSSDEKSPLRPGHGRFTRHHRGFSFWPGDDAEPLVLQNDFDQPSLQAGVSELDEDLLAANRLEDTSLLADEVAIDAHPLQLVPDLRTILIAKKGSTVKQTTVHTLLPLPQRDNSGGSAITAIRHGSSRSSSTSKQESAKSRNRSSQSEEPSKRSQHHVTAVAAARAASKGFFKTSGVERPELSRRQSSQQSLKGASKVDALGSKARFSQEDGEASSGRSSLEELVRAPRMNTKEHWYQTTALTKGPESRVQPAYEPQETAYQAAGLLGDSGVD